MKHGKYELDCSSRVEIKFLCLLAVLLLLGLPILGMVVQEPFFFARVQRVSSSSQCFRHPSPCKVFSVPFCLTPFKLYLTVKARSRCGVHPDPNIIMMNEISQVWRRPRREATEVRGRSAGSRGAPPHARGAHVVLRTCATSYALCPFIEPHVALLFATGVLSVC